MEKKNVKILLVCLFSVYLTAFIGSLFTDSDSQWYQEIKPSITPPGWVFPIVWNVLFFLIALSLYFAWTKSKSGNKKKVLIVFSVNFVLNILWSVLYFGLKNPLSAFIEIIILLASIISMIIVTKKISLKSAWLLVPYLIWVSFAAVLTYLSIQ